MGCGLGFIRYNVLAIIYIYIYIYIYMYIYIYIYIYIYVHICLYIIGFTCYNWYFYPLVNRYYIHVLILRPRGKAIAQKTS